jgi:hypothetical protein
MIKEPSCGNRQHIVLPLESPFVDGCREERATDERYEAGRVEFGCWCRCFFFDAARHEICRATRNRTRVLPLRLAGHRPGIV